MDACCLSKNKLVCGFDNEYAVNANASLSLTSSALVFFTCAGGGGGVGAERRRLAVRLCEWDTRVPLVSESLAQVATGRPTSLASKRKQRKMLGGKSAIPHLQGHHLTH